MKYNRLGYLIGEGFSNVFKNKKSTGASLMIMCATMIIFGVFLILGENINKFVSDIKSEQGFQVFIKVDATDEEIKKVEEEIRKIEHVSTLEFVSKEDGLNIMKERLKEKKEVLEGFNTELIKASYMVKVDKLEKSKEVQDQILKLDNIAKITSSDETVSTLINLAKGIRIVTGVILLLLVIISIFIIANTIKLTMHARRKEISIMRYVGATNSFIRWPFMVEGMMIGLIAVLISLVIISGSYNVIITKAEQFLIEGRINIPLLSLQDIFTPILVVFLVLGIGIGALGSAISMRKYLKV